MWRDVKSLIANEMAKMNEKIVGISQKLSSLEAKVLALEAADKQTVAPKDGDAYRLAIILQSLIIYTVTSSPPNIRSLADIPSLPALLHFIEDINTYMHAYIQTCNIHRHA